MRTTLSIDDEVFTAARVIAADEGRTIGSVISELARRSLSPTRLTVAADGFPVFEAPANLTPLTHDVVARALDEE
ncbi:MAG TPA: antitoxin [Tetrasphaera sp.]|jgi:hypothetical protein|uniref:antitoxin n=1 Tax=Nostocoides sp. TaxID=1917966 RepID=UPI002C977CE9|nr:antitoxin [Tetrasphaera sp.]HNQ07077.1 antitoxin [Tetrasphaera sp.]